MVVAPGSIMARLHRLQATGLVLGLEPLKSSAGIRPINLNTKPSLDTITGDILLLVLELLSDRDKVALIRVCRTLHSEQRRLRPKLAPRRRCSLELLVGARNAKWTITHCFVDRTSGSWVTSGQNDDALRDLETLSIVGRPDCALLVLSPFTDLSAMSLLTIFELDSCAIGNAGVGVLSAALRNGAMPALRVLDLRRNQVGDGGLQALATALSHDTAKVLPRLETLGLDKNCIFSRGCTALASALKLGAVPSLRTLFVDDPQHESLRAACDDREIDLSTW